MGPPIRFAIAGSLMLLSMTCLVARGDEPYGRGQFETDKREHWSFQSVVRPAVPATDEAAWVRNPIDAFVLAGLSESKLKPAAPANRATLLRRVYLDLIGRPPAPAEVDAFLADTRPTAFEAVVDNLLSRPQYGERWARHWLDVVRYAETNGYERDGLKPQAWRYRDWVIAAFNADKPYDQFLIEQLAGDEIPGSNENSQIGTTMLRLGPWDDEPADPLADRYDQLDDIVATTSATFLGLTLRCARCHDHKFEPFSQKDYTRWLTVFSPLKRPQKDRADLDRDLGPYQSVMAHQQLVKQLDAQIEGAKDQTRTLEYQVCQRAVVEGRLPLAVPKVVLAATSQAEPQAWRYAFEAPGKADWIESDFDDAAWKTGQGGFGTEGTPGPVVRTVWNTPEIWLRREFDYSEQPFAELRLLVAHDDDVEIYLNGVLADSAAGFTTEYREFPVSPAARAALRPGRNVLAVHCRQTTGGQAIDVGLIAALERPANQDVATAMKDLPPDALQALAADPAKRSDNQRKLLAKHAAAVQSLARQLATGEERDRFEEFEEQLAASKASYPAPMPKGYVWYEEGPTAPVSYVFRRGDPRQQGDAVDPGFPAILVDAPPAPPSPTEHSTGRRLQLARWLARPDHPLTARVMVNRLWQHHFGDGIVATENDFGVMGSAPANQPLLDWLASEFVARGWSIKQMHRLMLLSQTYQMASTPDPVAERVDPTGSLMWRFTPRRIEAEALRDTILAISGQLNPLAGGPGVYPKISRAVLETQSRPGDGWHTSDPLQAARRSVYVFLKRTLLVPELEVLDFPGTEESCEQRVVSTVAPQALTFLNGEFIHEQAQAFAERLARESGPDPAARIERAYRLAFCRVPNERERAAVLEFLAKNKAQVMADSQGQLTAAAADLKALAAFCLVLLNTNELAYVQ